MIETDHLTRFLSASTLFGGLGADASRTVARLCVTRTVSARETLFQKGEPADALVVSEDLLTAAGEGAASAAQFDGRRTVAIRGRAKPMAIAYRWVRPEAGSADSTEPGSGA